MCREQPGLWHPEDRVLWPHPSLSQAIYPLRDSGSPPLCRKDTAESRQVCPVIEGGLSAYSNGIRSGWRALATGLILCSFLILICDPGWATSSLWVSLSSSIQ